MTGTQPHPYRSIWSDLEGVPFSQGFVQAGPVRTRYLQAGSPDKPTLLFLHGTGGHAEAYIRNLRAHAEHFNTIAVDMLGHGLTDKPDYDYAIPRYLDHLAAFFDVMKVRRASLSGESLGGWVAAHFAVAHPGRVDRLVLNTAGGDKIDPDALAKIRTSTMASVEDPSWDRVRSRLEWLMFDKTDVHDDLVACRQRIYARPEMRRGMKHILAMHTPEARQKYALTKEQWASIKAPTLVLWTSHDPTAKVEVGQYLASLVTGAKFVVMQDCGHWPQFEDSETFNRIHLDFLLGR
jgi:2-hydroxy-6-oxonona-2,4-dienedioate hydrolase